MNEKFYTYRGYPLVRNGNMIYYGYMSDPVVAQIKVLSSKKSEGIDITDKVQIILMSTDPKLNPIEACIKNSKFDCGLYEALDTAKVWIEKALKH